MRLAHATRLHIVTSFCLEIWRFLSEATNTRLAYVANYTKKFVAAATVDGGRLFCTHKIHDSEVGIARELIRGLLFAQAPECQARSVLQSILDGRILQRNFRKIDQLRLMSDFDFHIPFTVDVRQQRARTRDLIDCRPPKRDPIHGGDTRIFGIQI